MDAPTTTSADNGTSGDGGGGGWFAARRAPRAEGRPDSGTAGGAEEAAGRERIPVPSRSLASIRPVGSGAARSAPPSREGAAGHEARTDTAARRQPGPVDDVPEAFRPRGKGVRDGDGPAPHPPVHEDPATGPAAAAADPATDPATTAGSGGEPDSEAASGAAPGAAKPAAPVSAALPPEAPAPQPSAVAPAAPSASAVPSAPADDPNASPDAILVRRTLAEIAPVSDQVTSYFYSLLFVRHPDLRGLFPVAMDAQRDRLLKALLTAAEHMDSPAVLTGYLRQLGRGHRKYGTQATHYPAVGEALLGALSRYASSSWDDETEGAWVRTYTTISQIMIDAAAENELHAPAWWQAEVVSHDLRTSDIAVVTVRPDQPYPFVAGQYTSLETPWWPRVWRHYSFASAPRPDGLLSFHVKAVPAGWVSNALVHHARPGDVLRLGPPAGSMTVDHSTDNGLLCLGGGTGIAPIKALVEDVAEHGHRRPVQVFYGARHDEDLYDIETMLQLQSVHPWLAVRPVVAEGPSQGLTGQLPEAVREYGPWHEYDAYLSGPPGMIRSSLDALKGAGIPLERIRHDSLEELVGAIG
ncbi:FAD-binding oxidoreductase [Streptomyces scopuliridis]|uniref:FAD-binding oxidoreductase n=1 Tax=Streptomyces scopuliridis TaxID=452529 RepID=A0ACD4ZKU5_9ACTN|nr:globin domain-containing protein [Streptomyces scopuliridis]WSB99080.1 FAD-binding oxidoreductase [Streptomyces scopuliridis]WSC07218.1 FAD-binding oxidoreductase [Streptomyces scopuliridis]